MSSLKEYMSGLPQASDLVWRFVNPALSPCLNCAPVRETICKSSPVDGFEKSFSYKMFRLQKYSHTFVAKGSSTLSSLPYSIEVTDAPNSGCLEVLVTPSQSPATPSVNLMKALNSSVFTPATFTNWKSSSTSNFAATGDHADTGNSGSASINLGVVIVAIVVNCVISVLAIFAVLAMWRKSSNNKANGEETHSFLSGDQL
jgi:hypothetical protein